MDTTDDASAAAVVEPMMTEDGGLINFPNEEVKVRLNISKNETLKFSS